MGSCSREHNSTLIVTSWPGTYFDAQKKYYIDPFQHDKKISIVTDKTDYGKIRQMVIRKDVTVDLADVETFFVYQAGNEGILDEIDYSKIDTTQIIHQAINKYGVGAVVWSTVIAFNKNMLKNPPNSWADFWDFKNFPGKRALRDDPISTLEIALLADGVKPDSLYPLDYKRAFRKLDQIKNKIIWWADGDQPRQWLNSEEVCMASAWNGRIYDAIKNGQPLSFIWNQGILDLDWWVMPKGAKHYNVTTELLKYASSPEPQALLTNMISYGPTNKLAFSKINSGVAKWLPSYPENLKKQLFLNASWWAKNYESLKEKWDEWKLK